MKITMKRKLCILNTFLCFVAYLLIHACVWLTRNLSDQKWIYVDSSGIILVLAFVAIVFAFWSVFWNPNESKKSYIVSAVAVAVPAIVLTVLMACGAPYDTYALMQTWRSIPAIILYFAVAVIYLVLAFTKNIETPKEEVPIPYSE